MHRFYVPAASDTAEVVELPDDEARHATTVLRIRAGDQVAFFDGRGREWLGRCRQVHGTHVTIERVETRQPSPEPGIRVTLAIGLLKGDQMDTVVRDATALGVAVIAPFVSAHTVVPEEARQARAVERWCRVAIAAAKQCGRAVVPSIRPVARFADRLAECGDGVVIACVEPSQGDAGLELRVSGAAAPDIASLVRPSAAHVFIGPEGGWGEDELRQFETRNASRVSLGPRTLRAETAPVVVLSALWTVWGWQ
jgi:16S rRNA (uracil1498-N3)-methyltransferase